jgi:phosphohistidine phosphatase
MKKLMLVRHAKSGWDNPILTDFERPLSHRGEKDAPHMAERLIKKHLVPQYLLSSPALRAKTTAGIFAKQFKLAEPKYNPAIYEATYMTLLSVVNSLPDEYDFVALFGHNPGLSQLIYYLTDQLYDMPTCGVVIIDFDNTSWKMVSSGAGTIQYNDYPKNDGQ